MVPVVTVESCTSIFQVREARTLCLFGVSMLFYVVGDSLLCLPVDMDV